MNEENKVTFNMRETVVIDQLLTYFIETDGLTKVLACWKEETDSNVLGRDLEKILENIDVKCAVVMKVIESKLDEIKPEFLN